MHLDSSKFLACHNQEANVQKNNYKVTLEDYTSENTLFKIVPAFKYQKDGDLVRIKRVWDTFFELTLLMLF